MRRKGIAFVFLIFSLLAPSVIHDVSAYVTVCRWNKTTLAYYKDLGPDTHRSRQIDQAATTWSDTPTPLLLVPTSDRNSADILVYQDDFGGSTRWAGGGPVPTCKSWLGDNRNGSWIHINRAHTECFLPNPCPWGELEYITLVAHEFGHALGLKHSLVPYSLMYEEPVTIRDKFRQKGIIAPVLDDIRAVQSLYGVYDDNNGKFASTRTQGSARVSGTSLPVELAVLNSGTNSFAMAYTFGSLPVSKLAMMYALVSKNVPYRFSMGWLTQSTNPDPTSQFATIEFDNDGIKLVYTGIGLFGPDLDIITLYTGTSPGLVYLQLVVVQQGNAAMAFAYAFDYFSTGAPLGHADSAACGSQFPDCAALMHYRWDDARLFEVSVWTDSSNDPRSSYVVYDFWNLQSSGFPSSKTTNGGFGGQTFSGGSVQHGTLITMADGSKVPVQNVAPGEQILMFDVFSGKSLPAAVAGIIQITVDNGLTISTEYGPPLRVDVNLHLKLYVLVNGEPILKPVTEFQPGDLIYSYDHGGWVPITRVHVSYGGNHAYYDLLTDPYLNADGQYLSFIANGYADPCESPCKLSPTP